MNIFCLCFISLLVYVVQARQSCQSLDSWYKKNKQSRSALILRLRQNPVWVSVVGYNFSFDRVPTILSPEMRVFTPKEQSILIGLAWEEKKPLFLAKLLSAGPLNDSILDRFDVVSKVIGSYINSKQQCSSSIPSLGFAFDQNFEEYQDYVFTEEN